MFYEENQQLGFTANNYDEQRGNDIMYAYENENQQKDLDEDETNFYVY
jgi:hypothetical protein